MFYGITDVWTFVIGTIVIVLLPGPNSLYVMTVASREGIAAGYRGACGIFLGDTLLMIAAATGVASLLQATPALFMLIKYSGAAYLAWLGIKLLQAGLARWRQPADPADGTGDPLSQRLDASRPFRIALLISLTNPKAILFFVSFFIQFVSPSYPYPVLSFAILGLIVQICSALYLTLLIFGGVHLARQVSQRRWLAAGGTGAVGALFIGFGAKLASASLN
ncbi:leucine efflux protein LeuE [Dechloromonas sp. ZS-1]|uniref:leucine efflux protein LeuE n=1 Tax=Dechloromonas sp. ZS-1 TaxID=3138067 RepID=UPI0031FD42CD